MWPKSFLLESRALSKALECVEGQEDCEQARELTREALSCSREPGLLGLILRCAMTKVLGDLPIVEGLPEAEPLIPAFVETSRRWLIWVTGSPLPEIPFSQGASWGAIQDLALTYWSKAVEALSIGASRKEARRLFRRATDFSSSYGVPINQAIQWTYAASFFPTT